MLLFSAVLVAVSACGTTDEDPSCDAPKSQCGSACVDTDKDVKHCGACGTSCAAGESCSDGECVLACEGEQVACGGSCVDVGTDEAHCGGCNKPCDGTCEAGVCVLDCADDETACGGSCVDLKSDDANCGACGTACGNAEQCANSECVCATGAELCGDTCAFLETDAAHCGECGNACETGDNVASVSCEASECKQACEDGFADCDGDASTGCEADLGSTASCGACNVACRADEVCGDAGCGCPDGQVDCNGVCVDTDSDVDHCGGCGVSCNGRTNSTGGVCEDGSCVLACDDGFDHCDGDLANGCELATDSDDENCGGCGIVCGDGLSCSSGECVCPGDLTNCKGTCIDTQVDTQNCGVCGAVCDGVCSSGVCCAPGQTVCDGQCVVLETDGANCGGCGLSCGNFPNAASGTCENSACTAISCQPNFGNCNDAIADGCEANLMADADNCGSCGAPVCEIGCGAGSCAVVEGYSGRNDHGCVLLSGDGSVKCWGSNLYGQMGNGILGSTNYSRVPGYVQDPTDPTGRLTGAVQVVTGFAHSCVRLPDSTVKCWGSSMDENGNQVNEVFPVHIKDPTDPSGRLSDVAELASGRNFLCALMKDTTVKCWGAVPDGAGGSTPTPFPKTILASDSPATALSGVKQIAPGNFHACALMTDGKVFCFGKNAAGELGDGTKTSSLLPVPVGGAATPLTNVTQLAVGQDHSCGLHGDGTVSCWGSNTALRLGIANPPADSSLPVKVTDVVGAQQISASIVSHTCAKLDDGTAKCWGTGTSRRLGNGGTSNSLPVYVKDGTNTTENLTGIRYIEAGNAHTCVWLNSGAVQCVGRNNNSQIGDGSTTEAVWAKPVVW